MMVTQMLRSVALAATVVVTAVGFSTTVHAAPYTSAGTCLVTDVTPNAGSCFGTVLPTPVNDSASLLNNNTFGSDAGLFGRTNWAQLAKFDTPGGGSNTNGLSLSGNNWSFAGSLLYDAVAIVLKQSNTFSAYLFVGGLASSGTWSTPGFGQQSGGLSHMSIYTSGDRIVPPPPPPPVVPLPAAGFLMLGALGGLAALRRRCKAV